MIARLPSLAAGSTDIITPVLLADNGGRASSLRLDILGAPGLDQVVVMLATQLLIDVIAHDCGFAGLESRRQGFGFGLAAPSSRLRRQ